ncbi:MAG: hypothetical protein A3F16_06595 [Deltaproteobacteria bacterium RIFCSPHIGHO2_12_FULL_43_9]|nr:MAG: hypothetical protein A3F16_06595 [Deltaproteobacteria bacterium RIFCSPHIGHO2_12_FULL_43_9]
MIRIILLISIVLNSGCASIFGRGDLGHRKTPTGKVAVVLSGGLSRAYSEIGVLRVLEREEIPIDYIIGTETGALVGAFYADQKSSFDLEWKLFQLKESDFFDEVVFGRGNAIMAGQGIKNFINEQLIANDLEDLRPSVSVVTTDLKRGETVVFERGSPSTIISASMVIPGIYPPVDIGGRAFVAGSLSAGNLPLAEAESKNVDLIIAVNSVGNYSFPSTSSLRDVITQDYLTKGRALTPKGIETPVIIITPNLHGISPYDADRRKEAFIAGMRATELKIAEIRKVLLNK